MSAIERFRAVAALATHDPRTWCLVRWLIAESGEQKFCGPLSVLGEERMSEMTTPYGFPDGYVGTLALFRSEEEALARRVPPSAGSRDVPTSLGDLHFSVFAFDHCGGERTVLYDGGLYGPASMIAMAFRGWMVKQPNANYLVCHVDARLRESVAPQLRPAPSPLLLP